MNNVCSHAATEALIQRGDYATAIRGAGPLVEQSPLDYPSWFQLATASARLFPGENTRKTANLAAQSLIRGGFPLEALLCLHNNLFFASDRIAFATELASLYCKDAPSARVQHSTAQRSTAATPPWSDALSLAELQQLADSLCAMTWATAMDILQTPIRQGELPFFSSLSQSDFIAVANGAQIHHVEAGSNIVQAGNVGTGLYLLVYGAAHGVVATGGGLSLETQYEPGALLGEESLLTGNAATTSIVATQPCTLVWLPLEALNANVVTVPFAAAEVSRKYLHRTLYALACKNPLLARLSIEERVALLRQMTPVSLMGGQPVSVAADQPEMETILLLVFSGCLKTSTGISLRRGDWLGPELVTATSAAGPILTALENTVALKLSKKDFRAIIARYPLVKDAVHSNGIATQTATAR